MWISYLQHGDQYLTNLDKVATINIDKDGKTIILNGYPVPDEVSEQDVLTVDIIEFTDKPAAEAGMELIRSALSKGVICCNIGETLKKK